MAINRRDFLKSFAALGAGGLLLSNKAMDIRRRRRRPNIVFIFTDDMGWTGVSYMGSGYYETPEIDVLSREGMVFTDAYTCGPNCAPTRACLMSGQYGSRHGVFTVGSSARGESAMRRLIPVTNNTNLAGEIVTIPEALKTAGYTSACIGKWHLGKLLPPAQGFDFTIANGDIPKDADVDPKRASAFTDEAIDFMEANKDRPFFLYLSHHAVHTPDESTPVLKAKYAAKDPWHGQDNATYGGMTEHTDTTVGRLLDKIDALGLRDDTVVIFYADNGGHYGQTSNYPLRGAKGMLYEGGVRVPMAVRWPGVVKAGSKCAVPVITVDFFPTFLEIAGAKAPSGKVLDGESIVGLLDGKKELKRDAIYWHFPCYLQGSNAPGARDIYWRTRPAGAIRKGDWKLIQYFEELEFGEGPLPELELYNLAADLAEENNLADSNTAKRDELLADLEAWRASLNAPIPTEHNTEYTG